MKEQIFNIDSTNKKIVQNNKYKELRDSIVLNPSIIKPEADVVKLSSEKAVLDKTIKTDLKKTDKETKHKVAQNNYKTNNKKGKRIRTLN